MKRFEQKVVIVTPERAAIAMSRCSAIPGCRKRGSTLHAHSPSSTA